MAITKMCVENFTVFEHANMDCAAGINIFVGENGTGKTHLLKYMYALYETANEKYTKLEPSMQGIEHPEGHLAQERFKFFIRCFHPMTYRGLMNTISRAESPIAGVTLTMSDNVTHRLTFKDLDMVEAVINWGDELTGSHHGNGVFIPAKEMLTHSRGLLSMSKTYSQEMPFDKTLLDIIELSLQWKPDKASDVFKQMILQLEEIIGGEVAVKDNAFYIQNKLGRLSNFSVEAEGLKKLGLLLQLLRNGSLSEHSVLFWDEPEANLNPKLLPLVADVLLALERSGIQVMLATHDYLLTRYLELKSQKGQVIFHSLYRHEKGVKVESNAQFSSLSHNAISDTYIALLDEVFEERPMKCIPNIMRPAFR